MVGLQKFQYEEEIMLTAGKKGRLYEHPIELVVIIDFLISPENSASLTLFFKIQNSINFNSKLFINYKFGIFVIETSIFLIIL